MAERSHWWTDRWLRSPLFPFPSHFLVLRLLFAFFFLLHILLAITSVTRSPCSPPGSADILDANTLNGLYPSSFGPCCFWQNGIFQAHLHFQTDSCLRCHMLFASMRVKFARLLGRNHSQDLHFDLRWLDTYADYQYWPDTVVGVCVVCYCWTTSGLTSSSTSQVALFCPAACAGDL